MQLHKYNKPGRTTGQSGRIAAARWVTGCRDDCRDDLGGPMSARMTPPFRADHVGSLLRPARLHQARADFAAGRISAGDLRKVEDEAIREVVQMQHDVGLQSATDGEFRRATW